MLSVFLGRGVPQDPRRGGLPGPEGSQDRHVGRFMQQRDQFPG